MKKTVFITLALLLNSVQGVFSASVVLDTDNSNWSDPVAWVGDVVPGANDQAIIRNQYSVTVSSQVGAVSNFFIGDTSAFQQTGTVNIVTGGKLISLNGSTTVRSTVGRNVDGSFGYLNLSGGTLQMGAASGTNVLHVGVDTSSAHATGIFTISGGTFDGRLLVGSTNATDSGDTVRIVGDAATIGTTSKLGNALEVRASGSVEFIFDATGISTMNYGTSGTNNGGIVSFAAGSQIIIDGAAYTGGAQTFNLITAGTLGSPNATVILTNFAAGTTHSWNQGSDVLSVTVLVDAPVTELVLPDIFADQMVFQREVPIRIWGSAGSNQQVQAQLILVDTNGNETIGASASVDSTDDGSWELQLPAQSATTSGSHHVLVITCGDDEIRLDPVYVGDVWICSGQSNMNFLMRPNHTFSPGVLNWEAEVAAAGDAHLNVFTVVPEADMKPLDDVHGTWRPDTQVYAEYFSAVPYLFGREIRREAGVPVGIIVASLGATSIASWMTVESQSDIADAQSLIALHADRQATYTNEIAAYYQDIVPAYRTQSKINQLTPTYAAAYGEPTSYPTWQNQPGGLYNGMLAPIEKFLAKGVVWYQGESDSTGYQTYFEYLSKMIASWRALRAEPDLPFLIVQLPNYESPYENTWAGLREAQAQALAISNVAVVVAADVGDSTAIHCPDKQTVAYRLGLAAMKTVYGQTGLVAFGPQFQSLRLAGSELEVLFSDEGSGLIIDSARANGDGPDFEVAGPDRVFHAAQCRISGDAVYLSSTNVVTPMHVRYAYHNDPKLILYNVEGLPAMPFRASPTVETMVSFSMDQSDLTPSATNSALTASEITFGPGLTASGYDATRGTPPPSFFVRTTSTPATQQEAIDTGCYMEVHIAAHDRYELLPAFMDFSFDIARSTGLTFSYAVRSSVDGFASDLCQADILTAAETFGTVQVPASVSGPVQGIAYRIYFWDSTDEASRMFRIDSIRLSGKFIFFPQIRIGKPVAGGTVELKWDSVPGRTHTVYKSDTMLKSRDQWEKISVPATAEGVNSYILTNSWKSGFFYIE